MELIIGAVTQAGVLIWSVKQKQVQTMGTGYPLDRQKLDAGAQRNPVTVEYKIPHVIITMPHKGIQFKRLL